MKHLVRNCKTSIIWLSIAHFVCDTYTGFLNPLMPFIAAKLGFTMALATVLVAITQICSNMFQPIFGFFADNINKRLFVFWGLILVSVFIPLAPSMPNVVLLTLCMVAGSLGSSFFHPQSTGFVNFFSGTNCSNNMGMFVSMGSLGFALGPLLAAFIAQTVGLEKTIFTSILGLSLAALMFLFVPKLSTSQPKPKQKDFISTFKDILTNNQMKLLILIAMMKSLVTNSTCILLPFLWKSMDYSAFYIGFALFLFVFSGAIGSFLSPHIEKRAGSKTILYFSMWATFPLMILFSLIYKTMPVASMIVFAIIGFTTMLAQPVVIVWAQKTLPEYKSITAGFVNGFCWGVIALMLSGLGLVAQHFGIVETIIVLTLIPALASYSVHFLKDRNSHEFIK